MRPLWFAIFAIAGCDAPKEVESLIESARWAIVPLESDPWAAHHPGPDACPDAAYMVEDLGGELTLGINGQDCAYLTVEQTSLVEVEQEDVLRLRVWHFALFALEVSTATLALTVDGHSLLDRTIPIPAEAELIAPIWPADFEAEAGSRVLFHLRNHGSNSYNLIELSRGGELP